MRQLKIKFGIILFLGFGMTNLHAQQDVLTTGGDASGLGGSVSYSIGQVFYTTNTALGGSAAQGVQQPFEIFIITEIEQINEIVLKCSVYPNPVVESLILNIESEHVSTFSYQLYDMNGMLMKNAKVSTSETQISMQNFIPASYFLKICDGKQEIKSFKIIKN